jgi:beta-lactamase superfamily II metal-dependent hydrolase
MKRLASALLSAAVLGAAFPSAQGKSTKPLEIWVVDVEGGKAALYVSPTGQTAIIDTGFPGARDLDRIMAAIADAGVKQIDYLLSTHYHVDHIGNLVELAKRIPIGTFVDHGPTVEGPNVPQIPPGADGLTVTKPREQIEGFQAAYAELYGKAKHLTVKPGDRVPITGLDWRIVTAGGKVLKTPPLPGGGKPNPYCASFTPMAGTTGLVDPDDAQSVGSVIILGQFRALDFGDMWRTKELELMCPNNPIGTVDLYFASSHGAIASGSLPFVHGLQPRVALMQNGTRKGGAPGPMQTILSSPGLEALWQMHWSYNALLEQNSPGLYIANIEDMPTIAGVLTAPPRGGGPGTAPGGAAPAGAPAGAAPAGAVPPPATAPPTPAAATPQPATPAAAAPPAGGQPPAGAPAAGRGRGNATGHTPAYWLRVSAHPDGTFTITNPRNGFSKTYAPRSR